MSKMFKLVRTDQDTHSTTLIPGIHEFGRGVSLYSEDDKITHCHGQLAVGEDNRIFLSVLDKNQCFVRVKNMSGLIVLSEGMKKELKEGDEFGLQPGTYWYRLTRNEDNNHECENDSVQKRSTTCEERTVTGNPISPSHLGTDVKVETVDDDIDMEEQRYSSNATYDMVDKEPPSQDIVKLHSPDSKCEYARSRTNPLSLSTESLHIDETKIKNVYQNKKNADNEIEKICRAKTVEDLRGKKRKLTVVRNQSSFPNSNNSSASDPPAKNSSSTKRRKLKFTAENDAASLEPTGPLPLYNEVDEVFPDAGAIMDPFDMHSKGSLLRRTLMNQSTHSGSVRTRSGQAGVKTRTCSDVVKKGAEHGEVTCRTRAERGGGARRKGRDTGRGSRAEPMEFVCWHHPVGSSPPKSQQNANIPVMSASEVQPPVQSPKQPLVQSPAQAKKKKGKGVGKKAVPAAQRAKAARGASETVSSLNMAVTPTVSSAAPLSIGSGVSESTEASGSDFYQSDQDLDAMLRSIVAESLDGIDRELAEGSEDEDDDNSFLPHYTAATGADLDADIDIDTLDPKTLRLADSLTAIEDEAVENVHPNNVFEWQTDFSTYKGKRETFIGNAGPSDPCDEPLECFLQFWDEDIMTKIATETNLYAEQELEKLKLTSKSRLLKWKDTNFCEIYLLFAIYILQSVFPLTKESEYWYTMCEFTKLGVSKIMTYDRFILLKRFLHFRNNDEVVADDANPKLAKLQPIIDHCQDKFFSLYTPKQEIAIDESLTLWKGKLSWIQYIQTKAARWGIKTYELCESQTGYLWKFIVYTGKGTLLQPDQDTCTLGNSETAEATTRTVIDLMKGALDKGYTLFMDNFYNCPMLARYLKSKKTDCVGTLRCNRKHVPKEIAALRKEDMKKRDLVSLHSGDVAVLSWKDQNKVTMISTYHDNTAAESVKDGKPIYKPTSVLDYNSYMGGVDLKDQRLSCFLLERTRNRKWYRKLFQRLLNASVLNAYIIYRASLLPDVKVLSHREFRYSIVNGLVQRFMTVAQPRVVASVSSSKSNISRPLLRDNHYPFQFPLLEGAKKKNERARKHCFVCKLKTIYYCNVCIRPLCVNDCFYIYHTQKTLPVRPK